LDEMPNPHTQGSSTFCSQPFNATVEERSFFEGMFESMEQGFGGTFDQLEQHLAERRD